VNFPSKQAVSAKVVQKCRDASSALSSGVYELLKKGCDDDFKELKKRKNAKEEFESDENWGLVKQVFASITKRKIKKLNKTYVTLSFKDISDMTDLKDADEAEEFVSKMILDGDIEAVICCKDRMVTFRNEHKRSAAELALCLKQKMDEALVLGEMLKDLDRRIQLNPSFIRKVY